MRIRMRICVYHMYICMIYISIPQMRLHLGQPVGRPGEDALGSSLVGFTAERRPSEPGLGAAAAAAVTPRSWAFQRESCGLRSDL